MKHIEILKRIRYEVDDEFQADEARALDYAIEKLEEDNTRLKRCPEFACEATERIKEQLEKEECRCHFSPLCPIHPPEKEEKKGESWRKGYMRGQEEKNNSPTPLPKISMVYNSIISPDGNRAKDVSELSIVETLEVILERLNTLSKKIK